MKKILLTILFIFTTLLAGRRHERLMEDVEASLAKYDLKVLAKLDEKKLPKYSLAVFANEETLDEAKVDVGGLVISALKKQAVFDLLERDKSAFNELSFSQSGMVEAESTAEMGKIKGADFTLVAKIVSSSTTTIDKVVYNAVQAKVIVRVSVINTETSEVILSSDEEGLAEQKIYVDAQGNFVTGNLDYNTLYADAVQNAANKLADSFGAQFPKVGFVLSSSKESCKIDLGKNNGLKDGDIVLFLKKTGTTYHPVTQALIDIETEKLGYGRVLSTGVNSSELELLHIVNEQKLKAGLLAIPVYPDVEIP